MIPNFIKKGIQSHTSGLIGSDSPMSKNHPAHKDLQHTQTLSSVMNDPKKKATASMQDLMTKSGNFLNTIQGTLDKQLGHIAEAVHIATHENGEFFSPLPPIVAKDFEAYLSLVKEHWSEYKDICSSLIRGKESTTTPSTEIESVEGTNAFREIPQVFFNSDYKQSGFEQHQLFTQPIRVSVQSQGKMSAVLAGYTKLIEQHLVKHLSNVDGLLRSLMTIAEIQSDIAIAHDRSVNAKETLLRVKQGEVKGGLRLVQLARRKSRIVQLLRTLDLCEQVSQAQPSVDSLVRTGDFSAATDLVQATKNIFVSDLQNVKVLSRVQSFIEEHGRNIDGKIETEFAELVSQSVFTWSSEDAQTAVLRDQRLKCMMVSMAGRGLLEACLQMKLKEVLCKRLKKEMKANGGELMESFAFLNSKLTQLVSFFHLLSPLDQPISALRLFESLAVAGLLRIAQHLTDRAGSSSLSDLKELQRSVSGHLERIERLYLETFLPMGLEEHLSFASSVCMAASQNGLSPNLDLTIAQMAKQRLIKFKDESAVRLSARLAEEQWDKPVAVSMETASRIFQIDPAPDEVSAASDSSPSSSVGRKFLKINRTNFLLVGAGLEIVDVVLEIFYLSLAVPQVALDCLSAISSTVSLVNSTSKELVLDGGLMTGTQKKVINATNLALASQCVGFLAQLVPAMCRKFCMHYNVAHHLVMLTEGDQRRMTVPCMCLLEDATSALEDLLVQTVMELNEHRMEVFIKLGDILVSRFDLHIKAWLEEATTAAMDGIVKDFSAMYKVLLKSLQTENLKRVFARALSESAAHFSERISGVALKGAERSEFACRVRIDLLYLFQNLIGGDSMGGIKPALVSMISEMLEIVQLRFPLVDKSSAAEEAVVKLQAALLN